jgi:hypothetical protein
MIAFTTSKSNLFIPPPNIYVYMYTLYTYTDHSIYVPRFSPPELSGSLGVSSRPLGLYPSIPHALCACARVYTHILAHCVCAGTYTHTVILAQLTLQPFVKNEKIQSTPLFLFLSKISHHVRNKCPALHRPAEP